LPSVVRRALPFSISQRGSLYPGDPLTEEEFVSKYLGLVRDAGTHYPHAWIVPTQGSIVTDPVLSQ